MTNTEQGIEFPFNIQSFSQHMYQILKIEISSKFFFGVIKKKTLKKISEWVSNAYYDLFVGIHNSYQQKRK